MKLLMHICCSNCATYPISKLLERGIALTSLWFNPNIHPFTEYKNRMDSLKRLEGIWGLNVEYIDYYGLKEYLRNVAGNEERRCEYCYTTRLEKVAQRAKEINADVFTTSLLASPYQKLDMIIDIGKLMQEKYSVEFYIEDFRKGFNEARRLSRELELYRQKYCGCVYSEMERRLARSSYDNEYYAQYNTEHNTLSYI
ncbi:MAG: epoxyqueuosine reductase QueH [Nitrospirae bacterium]|nr:epoxyqueuosine reductase QueH [Nitrospirota bacterium]